MMNMRTMKTVALWFGCALLAAGCDLADSESGPAQDQVDGSEDLTDVEATSDDLARIADLPTGVRVMTQNLYVGLDVFPIIAAPLEEVPFAVAEGFADLVANRPEDRMAAVATEIALVRPHLVGLQEVTRLFTQFPSDTVLGNFTPNATDEFVDFLAVLLDELADRGLDYEVAAEQLGTDIELPRFDGVVDGDPSFTDVRVKFSDVILRRADVPVTPLFELNYQAALPIPQIPDMFVRRNAVGVLATVDGETFRLVSTHLEPLIPGVPDTSQPQFGQVAELIELLATSFEPERETILVGDFNSPAESGPTYQAIAGAGHTDVWNERAIDIGPGFTCCQDVVLTHPDSRLFERIDLVWTSNLTLDDPVLAATIGDRPIFRTRTKPRLWPSDHAGVVAWLLF
jgi:endonuclease/exonuclease/phosphatase family metal-dependent hydrolase